MGFRINTNVAAMDAHRNSIMTNKGLDKSLNSLSSGIKINKAADDASGMAIANRLRQQAKGLGQSITNANDGIGVVQIADGALDEYTRIVDVIRVKAIQAASDGQSLETRTKIQADIDRLMEEAQNIAVTTSFNGQTLLDGAYQNKSFHVGAYSGESVNVSIENSQVDNIGEFAFAVTPTGIGDTTAGSAAGDLLTTIGIIRDNGAQDTFVTQIDVTAGAHSAKSIAQAYVDQFNEIAEIRDIDIKATAVEAPDSIPTKVHYHIRYDSPNEIVTTAGTADDTINDGIAFVRPLTNTKPSLDNAFSTIDVTTQSDAQKAIIISDYVLKDLDNIRSDIGSVQQQLESTIRNISVTQVNVTAAESQLRDVDFATESANFSKLNILSKSGTYAMSQANSVQKKILSLLT